MLGRQLVERYLGATQVGYILTRQEMVEAHASPIAPGDAFRPAIEELQAAGGGTRTIERLAIEGVHARTNGTLGEFTAFVHGSLSVDAEGEWSFSGEMVFYDIYDMDVHPPVADGDRGRASPGEGRVQFAHDHMPGMPFYVTSEAISVRADSHDHPFLRYEGDQQPDSEVRQAGTDPLVHLIGEGVAALQ